jgi:hypothetical protein
MVNFFIKREKKRKNRKYWFVYILRHKRTVTQVMIIPVRAVTGERGIEEGLLSRSRDKITGAPS